MCSRNTIGVDYTKLKRTSDETITRNTAIASSRKLELYSIAAHVQMRLESSLVYQADHSPRDQRPSQQSQLPTFYLNP